VLITRQAIGRTAQPGSVTDVLLQNIACIAMGRTLGANGKPR
jgi:hypothetical protein